MTSNDSKIRLAVAGFIHETNTYATEFAGLTTLAAFEHYRGHEIAHAFSGANHQVGGFIEGANRAGVELAYTFLAEATPSGTIETAYPLFLFLRLALRNGFSVKQIALCCKRFAHDIDLFAIFG